MLCGHAVLLGAMAASTDVLSGKVGITMHLLLIFFNFFFTFYFFIFYFFVYFASTDVLCGLILSKTKLST